MNIALVGQGPDNSSRLFNMSYVPFASKAYLDFCLPEDIKSNIQITVYNFEWFEPSEKMASSILERDPSIVSFSVYLWNYDRTMKCVELLKAQKKNIRIVIGGPQVSSIAEKVMSENSGVDIVAITSQNGENVTRDLVKSIFYENDLRDVKGICFKDKNDQLIKTSEKVEPIDYETMPSPYTYGGDWIFKEDEKYLAIIDDSRGCPYDCGYCFWGNGTRKMGHFPIERVLKDIEVAFNHPKVEQIYFTNSNMLLFKERAEKILNHILKQKKRPYFLFEANFLHLQESTTKILAKLPNYLYPMAIQSANPKALDIITSTRPKPDVYENKKKEIDGWAPNANYSADVMLALPGDDMKGFLKTLDFALSLAISKIVINYPVYLLPGTRFYNERESLGIRYNPKNTF